MIRQLSFPRKPVAGKGKVNVGIAINHKSCSINKVVVKYQGRTSLGSRQQDIPGGRGPVEGESRGLQAAWELEEPLRNMEVVGKHLVRRRDSKFEGQNKIPAVEEVFHSS